MKFLLGVDGGNTKTLALIARGDGLILGTGRAGCGDIYGATSPAGAIAEIQRAVEAARTEAGIQPADLTAGAGITRILLAVDRSDPASTDAYFGQNLSRLRTLGFEVETFRPNAGTPDVTGAVKAAVLQAMP